MTAIPQSHRDLLDRPLIGHLATTRPDGSPQVNPMWFSWDGTYLRFTNTRKRQKFHNIKANPAVAVSITDPDQPYRYLEVRGTVELVEDDSAGLFFASLVKRYDSKVELPPADVADRVVYVVRPERISSQG